jgi:hypothetical protein
MAIMDKNGSERIIQVRPLAGETLPKEWQV